MSKIGKLWTDSIAYIALLSSAGLSLSGNVVDTYRIRGTLTDTLDVWLAITPPALVVLMVHVFVSARWIGLSKAMQALRWLGCLSIGGVAMRASWIHLNDLMVSRGQVADVAVMLPLAIDFLAIMSTALILAGRKAPDVQDMTPDIAAVQADMERYPRGGQLPPLDTVTVHLDNRAATFTPLDTSLDMRDTGIAAEAASWLSRLDTIVGSVDNVTAAPVSAPPASGVQPSAVPVQARDLMAAWHAADTQARPSWTEAERLLAGHFGKSTRTVRRWMASVPMSS